MAPERIDHSLIQKISPWAPTISAAGDLKRRGSHPGSAKRFPQTRLPEFPATMNLPTRGAGIKHRQNKKAPQT